MQIFCVPGGRGAGDSWDPRAGQLVRIHEGSGAPRGVWECGTLWAHKSWWGSERLAGLKKDGSWGKLLGAGPGPQIHRKLEGRQIWTSSQGGSALRDQAGVEAWLAILEVAQA